MPEPFLNTAEPGPLNQTLLVQDPLASSGQAALARSQYRLPKVRQAGRPVLPAGMHLGEVQRPGRKAGPDHGRGVTQLRRKSRTRKLPGQHPAESQLTSQDVSRYARDVADFPLNLEPPILRGPGPAQNLV